METFEVHVTGGEAIHEAAGRLKVKTISVELLTPDLKPLRIEHMTSQVMICASFDECMELVRDMVKGLGAASDVRRVKVECPWYDHYVGRSLYLESHFDVDAPTHPVSRNVRKSQLMGTDRTYDHAEYAAFRERWKGETLELALYDTYVAEDADWLGLWKVG